MRGARGGGAGGETEGGHRSWAARGASGAGEGVAGGVAGRYQRSRELGTAVDGEHARRGIAGVVEWRGRGVTTGGTRRRAGPEGTSGDVDWRARGRREAARERESGTAQRSSGERWPWGA